VLRNTLLRSHLSTLIHRLHTPNRRLLSTIGILLSSSRLDTILHSLKMSKLISILTQTPSHDTTNLFSLNNILKLLANQLRSIPSPEEIALFVPVVLTTLLLISLTVLLSTPPRVRNRDTLASAKVRKTARLTEVIPRATVYN